VVVSVNSNGTLEAFTSTMGLLFRCRTLRGHYEASRTAEVLGIAVSEDGRIAVSAASDKTLKVWDLASGRELRTLEGHSERVYCAALSGDGRLAVSASHDKTLKVWDLASGQELHTLRGHSGPVRAVAISHDGCIAVSASADKTLRVWDVVHGVALATFTSDSPLICCATSADATIVTTADFGAVHFLRLEKQQPT